jgi:hypothetical protein
MTSLPQPNSDPDFNINTATNTFYKALADRLKAGQMTLDQARAAQAEMRALQLNPAAANRQAATDIAQRHLQVGKYSPSQPNGGLTLAQTAQATARAPYATLMMPTPQNGMAPQIKQQTPTQAQVDAYYAGNPDMNNSYWNPYAGSFETRPQVTPQGVGGMGQSVNPVTPPQEIMVKPYKPMPPMPPEVMPPMPQPPVMPTPPMRVPEDLVTPLRPTQPSMPGQPYIDSNGNTHLPDGSVRADGPGTRPPWAIPPMALPGGTGYDEQGNMIRSKPDYLSGIGGLLANFGKGIGNAPTQPKFIGQHFTGDAPPPGKKYIETPEGLVPVPINDMPMKPAAGPGLGRALGMTMQPQGLTLSGPGVGKQLTLSNVPMQGTVAQPASAPQGMAMGGLLRKYYGGGMC